MRVIVQGEAGALSIVRSRLGRGLRRQLAGALSLDLSGSELSRLVADGGVAHISRDLTVVADMAIATTSRTPSRMASDLTLLKGRRATG